MKYAWIAKERDSLPVTLMCQALEVSRSGYHAWAARKPSARDLEDRTPGGGDSRDPRRQ